MKKAVLGLFVILGLCLSTSVHGLGIETITNLTGNDPTGRFYFRMDEDNAIILGAEANLSTSTGGTSTAAFIGGVKTRMPVLKDVDIYGVFRTGSGSFIKSVVISKNWMTRLGEKLQLGLSIPLLKIDTAGGNTIDVLSEITPQVGMTLDI
jgi:hypothetical protein